ncbi:MAG TPA: ammonium transporter [Candidatus Nanopelagicales bacterium]|nr:ammonium transporter [Candidatus Nanopelagicales bacterium]
MDVNSGDVAWVLASTALVLLMTPGLAFFYGGMTKARSTLNMMLMSFATICVVSVLWVLYGFSLAFGNSGSAFYGAFSLSGLSDAVNEVTNNGGPYGIPLLLFAGFQLMFAVITPALISGAIADRTRFLTWTVFVALWVTIVYFPVAHWVFDFGDKDADGNITGAGWLANLGVEDFAGGTAVHINAGAAGLALAIVLGRRLGFKKNPNRPHNLPLVMIGAGLLWFGWFGFNAGSALAANGQAVLALMNTQVATAAALGGWLLVEKLRDGHPTTLGAASGAVAGLVAITPACAFVAPWAAVVIGLLAGIICAFAVGLKYRFNFDDSLDVVGVHLVGGIVGCLLIGVFGTSFTIGTGDSAYTWGAKGLLYGGGFELLGKQAIGAFSVLAYSLIVTLILGFVLSKTLGFRVSRDTELEGIDLVEHAESAYEFEGPSGGSFSGFGHGATAVATKPRTSTDTVSVTDEEVKA